MSDIAIRCEGLSKQYRIGERESYRALRDSIADAARTPFRLLRSAFKSPKHATPADSEAAGTFWALKDLSFEIKQGEVVGVIGRNGAGKSTLLKILSRITAPSEGEIDIRGRVGSLLEVGTGFHPELTGRENIYLNGAILGMKKVEIKRKFDEIVAFAEIDKFIDTPVKRYSSGMYVRLAFAVAVHLEPEILIIDEVLAVGDAEFQKKCFNKMRSIGQGGRTILFVSHNMSAVRSICNRGLILEKGRLTEQGETSLVVDRYLSRSNQHDVMTTGIETPSFIVNNVEVQPISSEVLKTFAPVKISVSFKTKSDIFDPGMYVALLSSEQQRLAGLDFKDFQTIPMILAGQDCEMGFVVDSLPLLPGSYQLEVHLKDMASHKVEVVPQTFQFEIVETQIYGGRKLDSWFGHFGLHARTFVNTKHTDGIMTVAEVL